MDGKSKGIVDFNHVENDLELKLTSFREECSCGDGVTELRSSFDEVLQVQDVEVEENVDSAMVANVCSDKTMTISEESRALGDDDAASNVPSVTSVKCLCKCATFPMSGSISSISADEKDNAQENVTFMRTMSLPVSRKLISAMKGSREKEGLQLKKLSVSWDPEVYDPPPSSVSHLPKRNNQSYRNSKKNGKGKQKGKNPQGSRKKDKKHYRKGCEKAEPSLGFSFARDPILASSNTGMIPLPSSNYKPTKDPILATDTGMIPSSSYKPTMEELSDFGNGDDDTPDSNCGSSFLRRSRGTMHYPYTEAT